MRDVSGVLASRASSRVNPLLRAGLPAKGPEQALQNLASAFISKLLIKSWSNPEQFPI
ncbi:hypothetical protein METHP15_490003 [Pseudomonas sp. P15-2025]